jgi:hypothetical protein
MVQALSNASRVGYSSFTFRSHNQILGLTSVVQNGCRFFPANYFGMSIRSRTFSPKTFSCVDLERRALLDHAAMCRRVAGEISHANAVKAGSSPFQSWFLGFNSIFEGVGNRSAARHDPTSCLKAKR